MKGFGLLMGIAFFMPAPSLFAHAYRMYPVDVEMKIEPTQIRVRINSAAEYWTDGLLQVLPSAPLPAENWPDPFATKAKDYVLSSFRLSADDRPLSATEFHTRFIQEPLNPASARVEFTLTYPLSWKPTRLSGRSRFFSEYYEEIAKGERHEEDGVFVTRLRVKGKESLSLELPYEKPDFDFPTAGYEFTGVQAKMEHVGKVAARTISRPFFWIILAFLGRYLYNRFFRRKEE